MTSTRLYPAAGIAAAALALVPASAQAPGADYDSAPTTPGSWGYFRVSGGSEARFVDSSGTIRLAVGCTRLSRQVSIARISATPAAALFAWTTGGSRNLAARFDRNAYRVTAQLNAYDPLLDAIAFSRGKFAVAMTGAPALVATNAPEVARVFEDCRA